MRIIIASSTYPASASDKVPRFVYDQAQALAEHYTELKIHILSPHTQASLQEGSSDTENSPRIKEHRFMYFWPKRLQLLAGAGIMPAVRNKPWLIIEIPFLFLFETISLYRLTRRVKPSYIYAHWFTPQGISASIVSRLTRTPFVYTSHSSDVEVWQKIPFFGAKVVRFFTKNASAVTAVSERSKQKVKSFYNDEDWKEISNKLRVIPMGIDFASLSSGTSESKSALKEKYGLKNKFVVFFIGRLTEKKGLQYLLPALKEALGAHPDLHLLIAGDGEMRTELEKLAKESNIEENVTFTGFVSGGKKQELFDLSDAVAVPSIITNDGDAEGLPVSFMEGLAAGKLCLATYVSGADDIASNGKEAVLVKDRDASALAGSIKTIRDMNKNQASEMKKSAQNLAKSLDWSKIAQRHYEFFQSKTKDTNS